MTSSPVQGKLAETANPFARDSLTDQRETYRAFADTRLDAVAV